MAKCGKLTKFKSSIMKKWTSFGHTSSSSISSSSSSEDVVINASRILHDNNDNDKHLTVYVGKSRRRYLVDSETAANPAFRELVVRSSSSSAGLLSESVVIACEVVLFEHLLWMLRNCKNATTADWQVSELVEFYAC